VALVAKTKRSILQLKHPYRTGCVCKSLDKDSFKYMQILDLQKNLIDLLLLE
jgi:hypothetical protein